MWESWLLVLNFAFVYNTFVQFSISLVRLLFWGSCEISVYLEQKPLWFVFLELRFVRYARFQYQVGFGWRRLLPWAYFETRWPGATSRSSLRQGFTNAKGGSVFRFSGDSHHHHLTARHPKCHLTASPWVASRSGRLPLTPGNYEDPASESMRLGLASFSAATWQLFTASLLSRGAPPRLSPGAVPGSENKFMLWSRAPIPLQAIADETTILMPPIGFDADPGSFVIQDLFDSLSISDYVCSISLKSTPPECLLLSM